MSECDLLELESLLSIAEELTTTQKKTPISTKQNHVQLKEAPDVSESVLLENLLSVGESITSKKKTSDADQKSSVDSKENKNPPKNVLNSTLHSGDTDSSDDEDRRNPEDKRYSEYGRDIKKLLESASTSQHHSPANTSNISHSWNNKKKNVRQLAVSSVSTPAEKPALQSVRVDTDPVFGLRIVTPLISSADLLASVRNRKIVPFYDIARFVKSKEIEADFVIGGVVVRKSTVMTSQKGHQYIIWDLSDLKHGMKTVSVYLFGIAHKELWKTTVGTAVGMLNPSVFDKKEGSKHEACLSIDNSSKVLILGHSKDYGICSSKRKDGQPCRSIVNLSDCKFCNYHVQQEYQKCSRRSELQANYSGRGLTNLRNKVLGKDQVFYAGKLYTSIPAKKSKRHEKRDKEILESLNGPSKNIVKAKESVKKRKAAASLDVPVTQRRRDLETLKKIGPVGELESNSSGQTNFNQSNPVTVQESKSAALGIFARLKASKTYGLADSQNDNVINKNNSEELPAKSLNQVCPSTTVVKNNPKPTLKKAPLESSLAMDIPTLGGFNKGIIDLNEPILNRGNRQQQKSKLKAIKFVQLNGPIKKQDPNSKKKVSKKILLELKNQNEVIKKVPENGFRSEIFKKMMQAKPRNLDLLQQRDDEEEEKHFNKLEMKESMEEKMITTKKVACKAVRCLECKYTSFSASQSCKDEKHKLKVFDATKRFFECDGCRNRTVCLTRYPTASCNNCGSSKWRSTGMMKEKIVRPDKTLSIRGGEQTFINSVVSDANLDLLVPDD